jgi:hypothetical protein
MSVAQAVSISGAAVDSGVVPGAEKNKCPEKKLPQIPPMSLARAVSISGAAVDSGAVPGAEKKMLAKYINQNLGYRLENFNNPPSEKDRIAHGFAFWPIYYGHYYDRDKHGMRLYLSDGGHSENLGVYSLVRRLPERIIIVDAEQDYDETKYNEAPDGKVKNGYKFDAYKMLQERLRAEMGVNFTVPVIDKLLVGKGNPNGSCWCDISPYSTKKSCFDGKIEYFPYASAEGETPKGVPIYVKYIKLSIDVHKLSDYPKEVQSYFNNSRKGEGNKYCSRFLNLQIFDPRCTFPQESTAEESYTREQFTAYRELGRWIVQNQCGDLSQWIKDPQKPDEEFCYCINPKDCEGR